MIKGFFTFGVPTAAKYISHKLARGMSKSRSKTASEPEHRSSSSTLGSHNPGQKQSGSSLKSGSGSAFGSTNVTDSFKGQTDAWKRQTDSSLDRQTDSENNATSRDTAPTLEDKAQTFDNTERTLEDSAPTLEDKAQTFEEKENTREDSAPTLEDKAPTLEDKAPTWGDRDEPFKKRWLWPVWETVIMSRLRNGNYEPFEKR
jgi:hypothetical protein